MGTLPVVLRVGIGDTMVNTKLLAYLQRVTTHDTLRVFRDFVTMSFCALSMGQREDLYHQTIKGYSKDEVLVLAEAFNVLVNEYEKHQYEDMLGPIYLELKSEMAKTKRGQFFTPIHIAEFMAKMVLEQPNVTAKIKAGELVHVLEPAVGGGQMLLSFFRLVREQGLPFQAFRATAVDIDRTLCEVAFVNCTLFGIPLHVIHGNFLLMQVKQPAPQEPAPPQPSKGGQTGQLDLFDVLSLPSDSKPPTEPNLGPITIPMEDEYIWGHFFNLFWFGGPYATAK